MHAWHKEIEEIIGARSSSTVELEIYMNKKQMMGYKQALNLTLETISPLNDGQVVDLGKCLGRVVFEDLCSQVNSPSIDASRKDGYAVQSNEIEHATPQNQVRLKIIGTAAAGDPFHKVLTPGTAVRILTGAQVPDGADAVLAEESTTCQGNILRIFNNAEPGRNILHRGADVRTGELIAPKGSRLTPGMIGILVAAGYGSLPVYRRPRVAILATGYEYLQAQPNVTGTTSKIGVISVHTALRNCQATVKFRESLIAENKKMAEEENTLATDGKALADSLRVFKSDSNEYMQTFQKMVV